MEHDPSADGIRELLTQINEKMGALLLQTRMVVLGPDREFQFLFRDHLVKMRLPYGDIDIIQRQILLHHNFYEHKLLLQVSKYVTPDSVVLDAGANIGNHTIFFSKICGAREVLAFEVMRETFKLLEQNVRLNELSNVRLFNVGLGPRAGRAELAQFAQYNMGAASVRPPEEDGPYPIVAVDSLALKELHFMKVDVEGSFLGVLDGARETLARCRPLIWIELRPAHGEREPGELFLKQLGYRLMGELGRNDFLFEPS